MYDEVLNLDWPDKVTVIIYADDLVILAEEEDVMDLLFKANETLEKIST